MWCIEIYAQVNQYCFFQEKVAYDQVLKCNHYLGTSHTHG